MYIEIAGDVRKIFATLDGFSSHLMNHYPPRSLRLFCLFKGFCCPFYYKLYYSLSLFGNFFHF
ncbi:hypothetical protein LguiA_019930 [Lonicera macranthoides]